MTDHHTKLAVLLDSLWAPLRRVVRPHHCSEAWLRDHARSETCAGWESQGETWWLTSEAAERKRAGMRRRLLVWRERAAQKRA